ncbi:hypothetical protein VTK26DRAFT_4027 [Humicola hyalothermophila]
MRSSRELRGCQHDPQGARQPGSLPRQGRFHLHYLRHHRARCRPGIWARARRPCADNPPRGPRRRRHRHRQSVEHHRNPVYPSRVRPILPLFFSPPACHHPQQSRFVRELLY